jgi:hypothetical protein
MKYFYLLPVFVVGCGSTFSVETPDDAGSCLASIPAACPDCMTMNPTDKPTCEKYLSCYLTNVCTPTDACGLQNGACGVNTIGGGTAPQLAAIRTYNCACSP